MAGEDKNQQKPGEDNKPDEKLGEGGMRALQAEREANKKLRADMQALQDKLQSFEDEKLTKEQQLEKRAQEAEARVQALEAANTRRTLRDKVAKEVGVPAELLNGDDEDELKASADRLKEFLEETTGPRTPKPNPHAGSGSGEGASDEEAEARAVLGF